MPSAHLNRREPSQGKKGIFAPAGFTVIELMVAVATIVIITSLAVPSWHSVQERKRLVSGSEQVAEFLSAAQVEAIMRNQPVTVSFAYRNGNRWCFGMRAGPDACDCSESDPQAPAYCQVGSFRRTIHAQDLPSPGILDSLLGDGAVTFEPSRGALVDAQDFVQMDLVSDRSQYALSVRLSSSGQVRICSEFSATQVPGYSLC